MQPLGIGVPLPRPSSTPTNPISNFINGVNNIINVAKTAATNVIQAASVPLKSTLTVYQPPQTYVPQAALPSMYSTGFGTSQPVSPSYTQQFGPLQTYNYNPSTNQPISITIQPQPVNVTVQGSQAPVIGPFLPAIEQALSPFVASIGQVVNPLLTLANKLSGGQLNDFSRTVNDEVEAAKRNLRYFVSNETSNLQRSIGETVRTFDRDLADKSRQIDQRIQQVRDEFLAKQKADNSLLLSTQVEYGKVLSELSSVKNRLSGFEDDLKKKAEADRSKTEDDILSKISSLADSLIKFSQNPDGAIENIINMSLGGISDAVIDGLKPTINGYDSILVDLKAGKLKDISELMARIEAVGGNAQVITILINLISAFSIIVRGIFVTSNPWIERIEQLVNAENKQNLLTADQYAEYIRRFPNQSRWSFNQLYKLGLNDEQIAVLFENASALLNLDQLIQGNLRGIISDKDYSSGLAKLGFDDIQQKTINKLRFVLPPVQDLITMAVREVFTPEQRKLLSLDENFPDEFGRIAAQQGLSDTWARNYWASHWQLPSPQQVFEMLHRRENDDRLRDVDDNFVKAYLKAADYAPVWRDKLAAISYNTLTRVDIRRMYKAGVLDDTLMHKAHLALGMTERDANFLDDFVRKTNLPEDETDLDKIRNKIEKLLENRYIAGAIDENTLRQYMRNIGKSDDYINNAIPLFAMEKYISGLENEAENVKQRAISSIISARQRGNISRQIAKRQLIALGLSDNQAEQSIIYADLQYEIQLKSKAQDVYQRQYALRNMNAVQFIEALKAYDFSELEAKRALLEAELMRADKTKKLSQAELKKLKASNIISEAIYQQELEAQGLTNQSIAWLMLLDKQESDIEQ